MSPESQIQELYSQGSQDERVRSRRSARSSSSEDSEVAEHNREILRKTVRELSYFPFDVRGNGP